MGVELRGGSGQRADGCPGRDEAIQPLQQLVVAQCRGEESLLTLLGEDERHWQTTGIPYDSSDEEEQRCAERGYQASSNSENRHGSGSTETDPDSFQKLGEPGTE